MGRDCDGSEHGFGPGRPTLGNRFDRPTLSRAQRFALRLILVPIAYFVAIFAGFTALGFVMSLIVAAADPSRIGPGEIPELLGFPLMGGFLGVVFYWSRWWAAIPGILLSETLATRGRLFHIINGLLATSVATFMSPEMMKGFWTDQSPLHILLVTIAGLAAGYTYWRLAGSTAGFYRPMRPSRDPDGDPEVNATAK